MPFQSIKANEYVDHAVPWQSDHFTADAREAAC